MAAPSTIRERFLIFSMSFSPVARTEVVPLAYGRDTMCQVIFTGQTVADEHDGAMTGFVIWRSCWCHILEDSGAVDAEAESVKRENNHADFTPSRMIVI